MSAPIEIIHQSLQQQFVIQCADEPAVLLYSLDPNSRKINFYRTYVPDSARGKGIARKLVEAGLSWARAEGYQIEASCSYVQPFLS